jgi:hypothetical protein
MQLSDVVCTLCRLNIHKNTQFSSIFRLNDVDDDVWPTNLFSFNMTTKHLILATDWRFYFWQILIGTLTAPLILGVFVLIWVGIRLNRDTYIIHDNRITIKSTGVDVFVDAITQVRLVNPIRRLRKTLYDIKLVTNSNQVLILSGIQDAHTIKESLELLISIKKQLVETSSLRESHQIIANPGSLERLNDLTGMLQEGLISYEDYLQERKNFEDS